MKKSMLTLFAFSALMMSSSVYSAAAPISDVAEMPAPSALKPAHPDTGRSHSGLVISIPDHDTMRQLQSDMPKQPEHNVMHFGAPSGIDHDDMMRALPSHDENHDDDGLENNLHKLDADAQKAFQQLQSEFQSIKADFRSHHMDRMHKDQGMIQEIITKGGLRAVEDAQRNVIGAYKTLGETKGYRYGLLYKGNLNQTPISIIESGLGTPANIAIAGASSTILGYLDNPNFNGSMGSPKQITLLQYTMPEQPVMDHAAPVMDHAAPMISTAVMPAPTTKDVKVQSSKELDEVE